MGVKIATTRFGDLDLPDEKVITFPKGLIGFAQVRRFVVLDHPGGGPFQWLQAVDVPELAFVVTDPTLFFRDYQVPVKSEELRSIGIESMDEGVVVVILVVPKDPKGITANLQGPIVINVARRLARQFVLDMPQYTTKHPIFPEKGVPQALAPAGKGASC